MASCCIIDFVSPPCFFSSSTLSLRACCGLGDRLIIFFVVFFTILNACFACRVHAFFDARQHAMLRAALANLDKSVIARQYVERVQDERHIVGIQVQLAVRVVPLPRSSKKSRYNGSISATRTTLISGTFAAASPSTPSAFGPALGLP